MNILLIGTRGVGKTTLIHSMYGHFQTPRDGMTMMMNKDHDRFMSVYKGIMKGIYPDPTARREKYDIALKYIDEKILDFSWVDYHGGIYEDDEYLDEDDLEKLEEDINDADGAICFFDVNTYNSSNVHFNETIQTLGQVLVNVDEFFPVSFVVTKCDLLPQPYTKRQLRAPLEDLIDMISDNENICGSLFQVSCGRVNRNIDMPLFFMFLFGVVHKHLKEQEIIEAEHNKLMNRSLWADLVDFVDSKWNGYDTDYAILNRKKRNFNNLAYFREEAVKKMSERLSDAIIFPED